MCEQKIVDTQQELMVFTLLRWWCIKEQQKSKSMKDENNDEIKKIKMVKSWEFNKVEKCLSTKYEYYLHKFNVRKCF